MTKRVVITLKVVNIQHDQTHNLSFELGVLDEFLQGVEKASVVVCSCKTVQAGLHLYLFMANCIVQSKGCVLGQVREQFHIRTSERVGFIR